VSVAGDFFPERGPTAQDVIIGREPEILADIDLPGVAAAIWKRTPDRAFQDWLDGLSFERLPELRTTVPVHLAGAAVTMACEYSNMPACAGRDMLASDAAALAAMLAGITKVRMVRLRLDVSDEVMCPKFHLDNVVARLLCTYRGAGTDYVPVRAEGDPKRVRRVPRGSVGLFRGRQWPADETTGLLHRSPAVDASSGSRLLLVIDPAD